MEACASSPVKAAPLLLTALRFALACWLDICVVINFGTLAIPVMLSILVMLTDFFDGMLARHLGCPSRLGAILDVAADFFYIASFGAILCGRQVLPLWFLLAVAINFLGFVLTSQVLKRQSSRNHTFVFDRVGRLSAALFYIMPVISYMTNILNQAAYRIVNPWLLLLSVLLAMFSFIDRLARCIQKKPG